VEPSITDVIHLEEGDLPKGDVTPHKPIYKMGDKGERGIKNLKKLVTSFMDSPDNIFRGKIIYNCFVYI